MRTLAALFLALFVVPAAADDLAPMALNSYTEAPANLVTARVFRQDGALLGNVQGVDRSPGGIAGIRIGITGPMVISLQSSEVGYDAAKNVVVTDDTATIAALGSR